MQSVSTEEPAVNEGSTPTVAPVRPKHKGSAQLFQNPVLERLSHTHIALPVGIFAATGIISMYYGLTHGFMTGVAALGLFLVGLLAFTLVEYLVHRYVYHIPATTPGRAKFQYTMHGVHHEYPKDKTRLAMPPIITVFVASLLFFIFRFSFGSYAFGLLSGFTFGYAMYLFVHYAIHAYSPPKNFLKVWWTHHSQHHYRQDEVAFGVSSTLWDHIIGTMPSKKNA
ncbi:sterol desaturase family protein [Hymenobacter negativus]|uniref:Sterol desaturase family protein n=1 Tax=Hymenobacter negativus TaxID=2795026 RepID=A0ABS0QBB5_9BACT|nr:MULTISPECIES: sterol desaturase family protein [Bacteria]MBH8559958.1 sterol desaturase family protein [Hymenobacter negativus]MBH8570620.1 sterol desaturase family protein [Hymenobacter negativus]MBR7210358.1 sterol desaturase family protein [Microvirga sp. STS02]